MQNGAISKYLTGFDRQLESVKVLGKMSDFTTAVEKNFIASQLV